MNEERKHYIIYKITNKINGKIYIGQHQTKNLDDGYMGSSTILKAAIKKYGLENFTKEIICECSSFEEMNAMEAEIVNSEFVAREDTYNLSVGGSYGWENCNKTLRKDPEKERLRKLRAAMAIKQWASNLTEEEHEKLRLRAKEIRQKHPESFDVSGSKNPMFGKTHTSSVRQRLSNTHTGSQNSQYGKHWWMNPETGESKSFREGDVIPEGWIRGRHCNLSEEGRKSLSNKAKNQRHSTIKNRKWINNGKENKLLKPSESLPDGWKYGAIQKH